MEGERRQLLGLSVEIRSVIESFLRLFTAHLHARRCVGAEDAGERRAASLPVL